MLLNRTPKAFSLFVVRQGKFPVIFDAPLYFSTCCSTQGTDILKKGNQRKFQSIPRFISPLSSCFNVSTNLQALFHTSQKLSSENRSCWNCDASLPTKSMFCKSCNCLNEISDSTSYFEVFELPEKFNLDVKELSNKFKLLQSKLHPDKFTMKSETELNIATGYSSVVNNAFRTLVHPLSRGIYMLERKGMTLQEGEIVMESSFLMKIMEINETLAETEDLKTVQSIWRDNKATLDELFVKLEEAFDSNRIADAKSFIAELKYYTNIDDKVKQFEEERGIYHH